MTYSANAKIEDFGKSHQRLFVFKAIQPLHPRYWSWCRQRCEKNFERPLMPLYPLYTWSPGFDLLDAKCMARQESKHIVGQNAANPSQRTDPLIDLCNCGSSMPLSYSKKFARCSAPPTGSANAFFGRLERRTTRSVMSVIFLTRQWYWRQTWIKIHQLHVFLQSGLWHLKRLSRIPIIESNSACRKRLPAVIGPTYLGHCSFSENGLERVGLEFTWHPNKGHKVFKWHQPYILEVEGSQALLTLEQARLSPIAGPSPTNSQSLLSASQWGTLAIWNAAQVKHRICTSVSKRVRFLPNCLQPRLQCVCFRPNACIVRMWEPSGRIHAIGLWILDYTEWVHDKRPRARLHALLTPTGPKLQEMTADFLGQIDFLGQLRAV